MNVKTHDIAKIKQIMVVLMRNPDGVWLRRLASEAKVPLTTVHRYLEGPILPFIDNMGIKTDKGFFGVRVIKLKPGILKQLEQGLTIEKLIKTRSIYQEIE